MTFLKQKHHYYKFVTNVLSSIRFHMWINDCFQYRFIVSYDGLCTQHSNYYQLHIQWCCIIYSISRPYHIDFQYACVCVDIMYSTIGFFNEAAVRIDSSAVVLLLGLLFAQPQDVLQPIESHLNDLRVHHRQQITQGFNAAQVHQISICKQTRTHNTFPDLILNVSFKCHNLIYDTVFLAETAHIGR